MPPPPPPLPPLPPLLRAGSVRHGRHRDNCTIDPTRKQCYNTPPSSHPESKETQTAKLPTASPRLPSRTALGLKPHQHIVTHSPQTPNNFHSCPFVSIRGSKPHPGVSSVAAASLQNTSPAKAPPTYCPSQPQNPEQPPFVPIRVHSWFKNHTPGPFVVQNHPPGSFVVQTTPLHSIRGHCHPVKQVSD